jgi:hypothetical protein
MAFSKNGRSILIHETRKEQNGIINLGVQDIHYIRCNKNMSIEYFINEGVSLDNDTPSFTCTDG